MKLYELAIWERSLAERIDSAEAPEQLPAAAELDALCDQMREKVEGCCRVLRNLQADTDALKSEADRLADRARIARARADWLKAYLFGCLSAAGENKFKAGVFALAIQKNSVPSVVVSVAAGSLPARFQVIKIEPDKAALLAAYNAGEELPPGVQIETGSHLRIR